MKCTTNLLQKDPDSHTVGYALKHASLEFYFAEDFHVLDEQPFTLRFVKLLIRLSTSHHAHFPTQTQCWWDLSIVKSVLAGWGAANSCVSPHVFPWRYIKKQNKMLVWEICSIERNLKELTFLAGKRTSITESHSNMCHGGGKLGYRSFSGTHNAQETQCIVGSMLLLLLQCVMRALTMYLPSQAKGHPPPKQNS